MPTCFYSSFWSSGQDRGLLPHHEHLPSRITWRTCSFSHTQGDHRSPDHWKEWLQESPPGQGSTSTGLQSSLQRASWTGQRQREFRVLEGLRPRGIPEEAIPFPEVLGYWGFRVENGEELRAVLKLVTWRRPWPCRAGPRTPPQAPEHTRRPSLSSPSRTFSRDAPPTPIMRWWEVGRGRVSRSSARHTVPGACLPPTAQDMRGPPLAATTPQGWWKWGCTQAPQVTREATTQDGQFRVLPFCRSNS